MTLVLLYNGGRFVIENSERPMYLGLLKLIQSTCLLNQPKIYRKMSALKNYVDVHAHLTDNQFKNDFDVLLEKCNNVGLEYIVCNGLEPISNREVLVLSEKYPIILPALGIYPLDAACHVIEKGVNWHHDFEPPVKFDIDAEIAFIDQLASEKRIVAVGECGLDKHYLTDDASMREQEQVRTTPYYIILITLNPVIYRVSCQPICQQVLRKLMRVAKRHDIPIILHTRKAEARVLEMLLEEGVTKAGMCIQLI